MSLSVNLISKNPETDISDFEKKLKRDELFGFESWRTKLWGHRLLKELGCKIIISLGGESNVFVYDDDLNLLKRELEIVLENVTVISLTCNIDDDIIKERVLNALEAVRVAQSHVSEIGVVLW